MRLVRQWLMVLLRSGTSSATQSLWAVVCRLRLLAIILPLHRLGKMLHYTPWLLVQYLGLSSVNSVSDLWILSRQFCVRSYCLSEDPFPTDPHRQALIPRTHPMCSAKPPLMRTISRLPVLTLIPKQWLLNSQKSSNPLSVGLKD